ncbi:hypothetical protein L596_000858 [Steinernema carpocapsae]|uniref:Uncharacterized protein n=1 Tax=Steinernema carpocapsae TaxID=34508 RepID=A0A4U8UJG6_STECR|nr:hypothetical protein L596_000858 [Steinernema carpocapsae]
MLGFSKLFHTAASWKPCLGRLLASPHQVLDSSSLHKSVLSEFICLSSVVTYRSPYAVFNLLPDRRHVRRKTHNGCSSTAKKLHKDKLAKLNLKTSQFCILISGLLLHVASVILIICRALDETEMLHILRFIGKSGCLVRKTLTYVYLMASGWFFSSGIEHVPGKNDLIGFPTKPVGIFMKILLILDALANLASPLVIFLLPSLSIKVVDNAALAAGAFLILINIVIFLALKYRQQSILSQFPCFSKTQVLNCVSRFAKTRLVSVADPEESDEIMEDLKEILLLVDMTIHVVVTILPRHPGTVAVWTVGVL